LEGRERGEIRVAEHLKVNEFPAIPGPEGEIITWLVLNAIPKFTANMHGHAIILYKITLVYINLGLI
jgi:hypothetical protein